MLDNLWNDNGWTCWNDEAITRSNSYTKRFFLIDLAVIYSISLTREKFDSILPSVSPEIVAKDNRSRHPHGAARVENERMHSDRNFRSGTEKCPTRRQRRWLRRCHAGSSSCYGIGLCTWFYLRRNSHGARPGAGVRTERWSNGG